MRRHVLCAAAIAAFAIAAPQAARWNFIPDWTFKGGDVSKEWTIIGQASWKATAGELVGTPTSPDGGWLILKNGLQDFQFGAELKCAAGCKTGVLVRARKNADGSLAGIFIPYGEGETGLFAMIVDASGRETSRTPLSSGGIGNMVRYAPPPPDPNAPARGRAAGPAGPAAGAPGAAAGAAPNVAPPAGRAAGAPPVGFPGAAGGGGRGRGPAW